MGHSCLVMRKCHSWLTCKVFAMQPCNTMTTFCYSLCSSHVRNIWFAQGWPHNQVMCINHQWRLASLWETANCLWSFTLILFWPGMDWPLWSLKWGIMHIYKHFMWKQAGKSWLPRSFYKTLKKPHSFKKQPWWILVTCQPCLVYFVLWMKSVSGMIPV